ncbi:hypothetical protein AMELA_G00073960 [Ameiurus melas]|uniref:Uncharacterized protein n=1 Tax=Ameiurus melas TaxID=219545 RepID=A0A7J6AZX6_AMEME|nr:hypothetical protein AMELA_G00073960 [Ameiurus melas]
MWTVYQRHARKLNHFHTTSHRKILVISWQNKVPDTMVLNQAGLPSIFTMLMTTQLHWAGHVVHMTDQRLPKKFENEEWIKGLTISTKTGVNMNQTVGVTNAYRRCSTGGKVSGLIK